MILSAAEIAALEQGGIRLGVFLRLAVAPVLRCWLGIGPIRPGTNTLDPAVNELYQGFGQLLNVPALAQLINGAAERVELSLSGVDDSILSLATFANVVQGKACDVGFGLLDDNWQMLGAVHWLRHYIADFLAMNVAAASDPSGQTMKTATLSIGSLMTGRRRAGRSYFNNRDQQARAAVLNPIATLDRFCELTPRYSVTGQKTWPKYA